MSNAETGSFIRPKDARCWALVRLAHEGFMMDKIMRQHKIVEDTVKGLQNKGDLTSNNSNPNSETEEEMAVSIGNESKVEHNYYQPPKQSSNLLPLSILAAGLLTGAGLYLSKDTTVVPPSPAPIVQPIPDQDIGVGFGTPSLIKLEDTEPEQQEEVIEDPKPLN